MINNTAILYEEFTIGAYKVTIILLLLYCFSLIVIFSQTPALKSEFTVSSHGQQSSGDSKYSSGGRREARANSLFHIA